MDDESFRIAELLLQGYTCGHVLAKLALEAQGRDDPDLVRAMSGLALGMGRGLNCGSLTRRVLRSRPLWRPGERRASRCIRAST